MVKGNANVAPNTLYRQLLALGNPGSYQVDGAPSLTIRCWQRVCTFRRLGLPGTLPHAGVIPAIFAQGSAVGVPPTPWIWLPPFGVNNSATFGERVAT